jgi:hypothetical protein
VPPNQRTSGSRLAFHSAIKPAMLGSIAVTCHSPSTSRMQTPSSKSALLLACKCRVIRLRPSHSSAPLIQPPRAKAVARTSLYCGVGRHSACASKCVGMTEVSVATVRDDCGDGGCFCLSQVQNNYSAQCCYDLRRVVSRACSPLRRIQCNDA